MHIILIGYRGSGKTTVGALLAKRLMLPFIDLDDQIMELSGTTIRQIFVDHGEGVFRKLETAALRVGLEAPPKVLSLGGGAVLADENRQLIAESKASVIYLAADAAELHRRICADPATAETRPHLTKLAGTLDEVESMLAQRVPLYERVMTRKVSVRDRTPAQVAEEIAEHFVQD